MTTTIAVAACIHTSPGGSGVGAPNECRLGSESKLLCLV